MCAATDFSIDALVESIRAPYELLQSLAGRHAKGLDWLTLLVINGEGIVLIIHSIFCIAWVGKRRVKKTSGS